MPKRLLRTSLLAIAAIGVAIAILVAVVFLTPFGGRMAARTGWSVAAGDSGLTLSISSTSGSLLRGVTLEGVLLADADGTPLLTADVVGARLGGLSLLSKRVELAGVRIEGARLLFATGDDGQPVGWSRLLRDPAPGRSGDADKWDVLFDVTLSDVAIDVRNAATGLDATIGPLSGTASGSAEEFDTSLNGNVALELRPLAAAIQGEFEGDATLAADGLLTLKSLALQTNAGDADAVGTVQLKGTDQASAGESGEPPAGPSADLDIESTHDLSGLVALLDAALVPPDLLQATGDLSLSSELSGPFAAPAYSTQVRAGGVRYGTVLLDVLTASLAGTPSELRIESLHAEAMGGALDATATVGFPDVAAGEGFASVRGSARFSGLRLDRLAALAPDGGRRVSGLLGGKATINWASAGLAALEATFDLTTSRLVVEGRDLGSPSLSGRVEKGMLVASGDCCAASLTALGELADDGLRRLDVAVVSEDLAALGSVFGAEGLAGNGTVEVTLANIGPSPTFSATADLPDLRYADVQAGPVHVEASGLNGSYDLLYQAFDSTLLGTASLDGDGAYATSVIVRSFDLAAVLDDSLREAMSLAGLVSGVAAVSGDLGGGYVITGEIAELDLAARRQNAALEGPFRFEASPDSIRLTEARLSGTFGELSVAGSYTNADRLDVVLNFGGTELSEVVELMPRIPDDIPRGQLSGRLELSGTRRSPVFSADVDLRAFEMFGLSLQSASLEAVGDSSDVVIDLRAASTESGLIWISGGLPVKPDSLTVFALDATREFGVSVSSTGFIFDAREPILPGVRGEKRFRFDGSALLTGTADSLASMSGSGLFSELTASFDLAEFSLADTVYFEVGGGKLEFDRLAIDVKRRHVLGAPAGGRVAVEGFVRLDGETRITASSTELDVGHLSRALGIGPGSQFRGKLNADATVEGKAGETRASFTWSIGSPRFFDIGFESASGSGTFESGVLNIDRAELLAGGSTIGVTGRVTPAGREPGLPAEGEAAGTAGGEGGLPEFDLTLAADGFRLGKLTALPPGLDSIGGQLDVDMRLHGTSKDLSIDGTALLAKGKVEGFGLAEPIKGIELDVQSGGTTVAVRRISARSGDGGLSGSALVDLSQNPADPTFLIFADLDSPDFEIVDLAEGTVSGHISWGGTVSRSSLRGNLNVEKATITRSVGLGDLVGRAPKVIIIRRSDDARANVGLDLDISVEDAIVVKSNVAKTSLEGGASVGGTMLAPRLSGSFRADDGTFSYLKNSFTIEEFGVDFIEAERRDPYIKLRGVSKVESRSGDEYTVTAVVDGYALDAVPQLTSVPALSGADIVSLLTFGNTFGALVSGGQNAGSSGDDFSYLARRAFLSSAFGLAERTLEELLHLDRVTFEEEELVSGNAADADVSLEKEFGGRLRVNYTTSVGRFSNQRVEVSFELARRLWLETRTNPEGNHAIGVKLQIPFK